MALGAACLLATGCGGGSSRGSHSPHPFVTVLMSTAPDSLDPAVGSNSEALEAEWLVYTPLLTYAHMDGAGGTHVVAGLAQTLPFIWGGGRGYTFTLRPGLRYSNGQPVHASDVARAVQRAIRLWPRAKQLIVPRIAGAGAFSAGHAKSISGITTDDPKGQITFYLTAPDGSFENVMALPALAPVPASTPLRDERATPPPGVGPYKLGAIVPGRSFSLIRNPGWGAMGVSNVPAGRVDVGVRISGDGQANARAVLADQADVLDWATPVPAALERQIRARAGDRYLDRAMQSTDLIFLNVNRRPFSSQLAREAVRAAIDQATMSAIDSGRLRAGCFVLPPTLFGHPHDACPDNSTGRGDPRLAISLLRRSGMSGARVVVWSEESEPVLGWMTYYTSLLNRIGFRATLKPISAARYYSTLEQRGGGAQTGFGELDQELPNPAVFYQALTGRSASGSVHNWSEIDDPYIDATVRALAAVPASTLQAVEGYWQALERYVAQKAYVAVIGYGTVPEFVSSRIDFDRLILSPVAGYDWSSIRLR